MPFTVVTANLLHGLRLTDGQVDPDDLRAAAAMLDGDVVGLQEIDVRQTRSGNLDQPAVIADALDLPHRRFVPTLLGQHGQADSRPTRGTGWSSGKGDGSAYGIALLTRWPVRSWHIWRFGPSRLGLPLVVAGEKGPRLGLVPDEPRAAIAAVVDGPHGPMTLATAHLSFVPGRNARQLRHLTRALMGLPGPRLLFGDFNLPSSLPRRLTGWDQPVRVSTYPSWSPKVQFDHLLTSGFTPSTIDAEGVRLPLSDHCALRVHLHDAASTRSEVR